MSAPKAIVGFIILLFIIGGCLVGYWRKHRGHTRVVTDCLGGEICYIGTISQGMGMHSYEGYINVTYPLLNLSLVTSCSPVVTSYSESDIRNQMRKNFIGKKFICAYYIEEDLTVEIYHDPDSNRERPYTEMVSEKNDILAIFVVCFIVGSGLIILLIGYFIYLHLYIKKDEELSLLNKDSGAANL